MGLKSEFFEALPRRLPLRHLNLNTCKELKKFKYSAALTQPLPNPNPNPNLEDLSRSDALSFALFRILYQPLLSLTSFLASWRSSPILSP